MSTKKMRVRVVYSPESVADREIAGYVLQTARDAMDMRASTEGYQMVGHVKAIATEKIAGEEQIENLVCEAEFEYVGSFRRK